MQKLKSLEISFLECQRFRSQMLWKLLEIDKVNTNTSPLKIDSATSMCFIGIFFSTWIFTAGLDYIFLHALPNPMAPFVDVCLEYILFSCWWFLFQQLKGDIIIFPC